MRKPLLLASLAAIPILCILVLLVYNLPPVHDRLAWRLETLRTQVRYALNPPGQVVFLPQGQPATPGPEQQALIAAIVDATMTALVPSTTPTPLASLTPVPTQPGPPTATPTNAPSPTATLPPTPLPPSVNLTGAVHEYQKMNNCGPTTLAMGLTYWGWQGDQFVTRAYLRPNYETADDKNVMPAEMEQFVESQTGLQAVVRVAGNLDILKRLIASGFPVLIEKGFQPPKEDWMGHFELITGYDDARQRFITQDSYIMPDFPVPYAELSERWWRDFNNVYLVIYPTEREAELLTLLGEDADPVANYRHAVALAQEEVSYLSGRELFFAWFNLGSNLTALGEYTGAAQAFDQAFQMYASLPEAERPWRTLWYRVEPYQAYYETGRYEDVITLGNQTLSTAGKPVLEESFYWLGKAREATGDMDKAVQDYQQAYSLNPNSTPAGAELTRLGVDLP